MKTMQGCIVEKTKLILEFIKTKRGIYHCSQLKETKSMDWERPSEKV